MIKRPPKAHPYWVQNTRESYATDYKSDKRYHGKRWQVLRNNFIASHPLCAECQRNGIITAATIADHIKPAPMCTDEEFFNPHNLQPLCAKCNREKGQRDKEKIAEWRRQNPR